jgi:signal transduction histidine kinase
VQVRAAAGRLSVTIENRVGGEFGSRGTGSGLGLVGMRERVESAGGRLSVDDSGGRFRVHAELSRTGAVVR